VASGGCITFASLLQLTFASLYWLSAHTARSSYEYRMASRPLVWQRTISTQQKLEVMECAEFVFRYLTKNTFLVAAATYCGDRVFDHTKLIVKYLSVILK